ncbi:hypothetical protein GJR96_17620 [Haloferax sp. MBLA0076]|uniref:Uncharacterized protein n=1 Tax=Haloferax litoreum TaxID=2666140 RepID=A0A6A8GK16_9EURY|nr:MULTISPECIES: hypothetical protein [Haloferax]KAB1189991.1 hypothetical protein Hfx1148_17555 [Haloferax sp. CBA1148]MRX23764.1 hypothetical protein [Haloferax litoreum]
MGRTDETNSLEVRWFGTGSPPQALSEWVSGFGDVEPSQRTDVYLSPLDSGLNLKLRGGGADAVELKYRLGSGTHHVFSPEVTGTVEQWYKWSFPLEYTPSLWSADPTGLWVSVEKTRMLSAFETAELRSFDDSISATDATAHVEVTEVTALSNTGWTCGVEATGPPDALEDVLVAVGARVFGESFPVELTATQSLGYAAWLRGVSADSTPTSSVLVPSNR